MPIKDTYYLSEIVKIYQNNPKKVAFFIGAGLSTPIFPSWHTLLKDAIECCEETGMLKFNKNELLLCLDKGLFYPEIAEFCKKNLSTTAYRDFLEKHFDKNFDHTEISAAYKLIFELDVDLIFTSNYDLIPNTLTSKYRFFSNNQPVEASRAIRQGKKVLFKIHGDISDQDSIVLSYKDYEKIIKKSDVENLIKTAFSGFTFIFLGFGLNDPHINMILNSINNINQGMQLSHYALLANVTAFESFVFEQNYSVKVIPYKPSASNHPEVRYFLDLLKSTSVNLLTESFQTLKHSEFNNFSANGILKISNNNSDRISDYKKCLENAEGEIFITGTSMIHLSEDSASILIEKSKKCSVKLLILDPNWAKENYLLFTFLENDNDKMDFHLEIRSSIRKLLNINRAIKNKGFKTLQIRTYKTFFPYIITGYYSTKSTRAVVEITDYIPSMVRPRLTLNKSSTEVCLYSQIKEKFDQLWDSEFLTEEIL